MAGQYFYDPRPFYGHNGHTGLMPLDELFYGRYDPVVPYWMDQRMMSFDDTFYKQQLASRRGGPEVMQQQYLPQRGENNLMPYKRPELVRDDMYTDMYTRRSPYNYNYSNYGRDGFAVSAPMQFRGQQSQDDNWVHAMSAPPAPYGHGQGYRGLPEPPPGGMPTRVSNGTGVDQYHQSNQGREQYRQMEIPANSHMMSNQNNMASNMSNRDTHGNSHGSNQGNSHGSNQGNSHGSNHGNNHGSNQGNSHGSNHGNSHGNSHGNNHGNSHGNGYDNNHGNSHGNSHSNSHSNSHGNNHGNSHGNNSHGNSQGNNHGNSQGSLGTKQMGFSGTQTGSFGKPVGKSSSMQTSKQTTINNSKRYDSSSSSDSDDDDDNRRGHNNGSSKWGTVVKSTHGHGGKASSGHGHHSSSHGYESNARGVKSSSHSKKSSSHGHGGQSKISRLLGFRDDSSSSEDESYGHGGAKGSSKGSSKGPSANQHGGHGASFQPNYGAQPKQMQFSSQSKAVELKVPICCDNCERKVRSCLEKMHGVESVLCDQWNRKVTVYGNLKADDVVKRVRRVKKTSELWSLAKQQQQQQQQLVRVY